MLALAMVLASTWCVAQLVLLGSATRSVRLAPLLSLVGLGMYGVAAVTIVVQFAVTRTMAWTTGWTIPEAVTIAAYTVDPFVEEVLKVAPLVVFALWWRASRQWGLTDWLLAGASTGAGFGLLEALLRFAHQADRAITVPGGWVLPLGFAPPTVPFPSTTFTTWLPKPFSSKGLLELDPSALNEHVVWSAVAGLGVGLALGGANRSRVVGACLVLWAGADHAASNYAILGTEGGLGDVLAAPFALVRPLFGLLPLAALGVAVTLDRRQLRAALARDTTPLLADERDLGQGTNPLQHPLLAYALHRLPWTTLVAWRFALRRRAAVRAGDQALLTELAGIANSLDRARARTGATWTGPDLRSLRRAGDPPAGTQARRPLLLAAYATMAAGTLWSLGVGTTPWPARLLQPLDSTWTLRLLLVPLLAGIGWNVVALRRGLPVGVRARWADVAAATTARTTTVVAGTVLASVVAVRTLAGARATEPALRNLHLLDALGTALLVVGIALLVAAFLLFPPVGIVATSAGAFVVSTVTTAYLATTALGLGTIVLSQAVGDWPGGGGGGSGSGGSGSGGSGGRVPDIPRTAPRPRPQVRHWRLRNIVDDLWRGTGSRTRVGDGTTMDAFRNEVLTGRATGGKFHRTKLEGARNGLRRWLRGDGANPARSTRQDRLAARELLEEIDQLLTTGGAP